MLLLAAAQARIGRENILTGRPLEDWREEERREEGAGIVAAFADKRSGQPGVESGSLLVGADGIHSALRRRLYPDDGPPLWTGSILCRATATAKPTLTGRSMILAGPGVQIGRG